MNKLCERARSERAWKIFPFSHSKTAISFNILLVLLILYIQYFQVSNYIFIYIHIQSIQSPVITYGMALYFKTTVYRQNTNIEKIYVYASELRKVSHFYILKLLYISFNIFCWYFRYFVGTNYILVGLHVPTNSEKHYWGGGGTLWLR